ncbi:MAG: hypothetical protein M3Q22_00705 [Actinomycetota bacterium]|nr:hypothetical protein [Actinomycetota bacterium]
MTEADVQHGLQLNEAEERGRRQGYVQGGQDALDAVQNASLLDRMRGGDRLTEVIKGGMREREPRRRKQLPPLRPIAPPRARPQSPCLRMSSR